MEKTSDNNISKTIGNNTSNNNNDISNIISDFAEDITPVEDTASVENTAAGASEKTKVTWLKGVAYGLGALYITLHGVSILYNYLQFMNAQESADAITSQLNQSLSSLKEINYETTLMQSKLEKRTDIFNEEARNNSLCQEDVDYFQELLSYQQKKVESSLKKAKKLLYNYDLLTLKKESARVMAVMAANRYLNCAKNPFCYTQK